MVKIMRPGPGPNQPDDIDRVVCDGCGVEIPLEDANLSDTKHWCAECTELNRSEADYENQRTYR